MTSDSMNEVKLKHTDDEEERGLFLGLATVAIITAAAGAADIYYFDNGGDWHSGHESYGGDPCWPSGCCSWPCNDDTWHGF